MVTEKKTIVNGQSVTVLEVDLKWYTLKELALLIYKVDKKTLRNKMKPHLAQIGPRIGYFYNVNQVKTIFELIEPPHKIVFKTDNSTAK